MRGRRMIFRSGRMSCEGQYLSMHDGAFVKVLAVAAMCILLRRVMPFLLRTLEKAGKCFAKVCSQCMSREVQTVDALTLGSAGYALARLFLQELPSLVAYVASPPSVLRGEDPSNHAFICRKATAAMLKRSSVGTRAGFARNVHVHFKNVSLGRAFSGGALFYQNGKGIPIFRQGEITNQASSIVQVGYSFCHRCFVFFAVDAVDTSRPAQG